MSIGFGRPICFDKPRFLIAGPCVIESVATVTGVLTMCPESEKVFPNEAKASAMVETEAVMSDIVAMRQMAR